MLDRIDIHIEVPRVDYEKLSGDRVRESSEVIRAHVQAARDIKSKLFSKNASFDIVCMHTCARGDSAVLQAAGQRLMRAAVTQRNLSARAYHRILKLARSISDLAGSEEIQSMHLGEALRYRERASKLAKYGENLVRGGQN